MKFVRIVELTSPYTVGDDIADVQKVLKVKVDGIYGPITADAVTEYRKNNGLPEGNFIDKLFWNKMFPTARETLLVMDPYMRGDDVLECQKHLRDMGLLPDTELDGLYGPITEAAVKEAQKKGNLAVDGICGPQTWTYFVNYVPSNPIDNDVFAIQTRLHEWGFGGYVGSIDGKYGPKTTNGVREFQKAVGLVIDGECGIKTREALAEDVIVPTRAKELFVCGCDKAYCDGYAGYASDSLGLSLAALIMLERYQAACYANFGAGAKVHITSERVGVRKTGGNRCKTWNSKVGGASGSQHMYHCAFDYYVDGVSASKAQALADKINPYGGCSLKYSGNGHIDTRGHRSRW